MPATTAKTDPTDGDVADDVDDEAVVADEPEAAESDGAPSQPDATSQPDDADPPDDPDRQRRWPRRLLAAIVVTVFVAALMGAGYLGWKHWQTTELANTAQQARLAAESYVQVLTSIDSDMVDENFQQVLDGATGEFKDMYSQSSVELRQLLIDNKAAAHGVVVESAVQSATPTTVVVLLFVDQSVSNSSLPDPRIDRSRIKMTMEYVDDRWGASKVELP